MLKKIASGFNNGILLLSKRDDTKTDSCDQQLDILDTPEQKRFNDILGQIKEELKKIDMSLFSKYFSYGRPGEMPEGLYNSKRRFGNYNKLYGFINILIKLQIGLKLLDHEN